MWESCSSTTVSAFNTIVPSKLIIKLRDLWLNIALCDWILNFLMGRPQAVEIGNTTSWLGTPQGGVLSPLLYSLFTHNCIAPHSSNTIVPGQQPPSQRQQNKRADCGQQEATGRRTRPPLQQWGYSGESQELQVPQGSHPHNLTWTHHTNTIIKTVRQQFIFLHRLWRLNMDSRILYNFYRCTIERILTGCITAWYGSCTTLNRKALQRVEKTAHHQVDTAIHGGPLHPAVKEEGRRSTGSLKTTTTPATNCSACCHLADGTAASSPSTTRLRDSFIPQAIILLNSWAHELITAFHFTCDLLIFNTSYFTPLLLLAGYYLFTSLFIYIYIYLLLLFIPPFYHFCTPASTV